MADPRECLLSWAVLPFAPPHEAWTLFPTRCFGWIPSPVISHTSGNWFKPLTFAKQIIVLSSGNALNSKLCLTLPFGCHNLPLYLELLLAWPSSGPTLCRLGNHSIQSSWFVGRHILSTGEWELWTCQAVLHHFGSNLLLQIAET